MISIGDRLDNKYLVTRQLGDGGFGVVYLANDEEIPGRQVAIKVLLQPQDEDHSDLRWEMQQLARFNHPHVVAFYHHFNDEQSLYLVMEFCPAGSLDERLLDEDSFAEEQVFEWGLELCETLAFVHEKKIVHHDIKPQNILFAEDDTIKLGDFGMANRNGGTIPYLSPEMLLGERVSRTDPRVDVYALGLTLLELLTGRHPFEDYIRHDFNQPIVAIGYLPTNDLMMKHESVSRRHCLLVNFLDDVWLYDLESTCGTTVDGQRLVGRMLLDGVHVVSVAGVQLRIAASSDQLI